MARFRRGSGCAVVLAALAIVPAAGAQGAAGIQIDPHSPSGTEYQLPLERARQDAQQGGRPKKVRPGERTAPAFGEGIQTAPASGTAPQNEGLDPSSGTTRSRAKTRASHGRVKKRTSHSGATRTVTAVASRAPAPPPGSQAAGGPGNSLIGVGAIAAGVLALGAGIGLLLRRRARAG